MFNQFKVPPFTLPFNLCAMGYLSATSGYSHYETSLTPGVVSVASQTDWDDPATDVDGGKLIEAIFKGA